MRSFRQKLYYLANPPPPDQGELFGAKLSRIPTQVVNIRHETADVYCGRGQPLGNRFMRPGGNRNTAIQRFKEWFLARVSTDPEFRAYVLSLAGKKLGCHCKPSPCHLDAVVSWIEAHR